MRRSGGRAPGQRCWRPLDGWPEASAPAACRLITTNDNVDALRFYQRRGYRLARVDAGAVDRSRVALKPAIPEIGAHGIPLRDELELELLLGEAPESTSMSDAPTLSRSSSPWRVGTRPRSPAATRPSSPPTSSRSASSGRLWTRAEILESLHAEPPNASVTIESFHVADLGPDVVLASYDTHGITSGGEERRSRRSSIWVRHDDRWQIRFNQGTPISRDEDEGAG